ncbi:MAG TPA: hypothetical protein VJM31_19320 [Vicinamibacterales bacterium]|nr:hypothetical protein [Vicinamibacterales bacterium]
MIAKLLGMIALGICAGPSIVQAQVSTSDPLQELLRPGKIVVVTDESGKSTRGLVSTYGPSSLVLLTRPAPRLDQTQTWSEPREFDPGSLVRIRHIDRPWNGLVWGFLAAAGPASFVFIHEDREVVGSSIAAGGMIAGAAIDALRNQTVYQTRRRVALSPVLTRDRQSVSLSLQF